MIDRRIKSKLITLLICLALSPILLVIINRLPFTRWLNWKIYDKLMVLETKLHDTPSKAADILLVTLDNKTLSRLPHRWPYPRSYFAKTIENLNKAGAKLIAFDFIFLGKSFPEDDLSLKESLNKQRNIVLPITINEEGELDLFSATELNLNIPAGIITKLQDKDDVIRRNITFLVNEKNPGQVFFSWETQLLNQIKRIDTESLRYQNSVFYFHSSSGEQWSIPVDADTGGFLIHFCCNTSDFNRLSFYDALKNDFNPDLARNKIVLIGFLSQTFGDIHNTPLGWLPGVTLNANAFLALYRHDFLHKTGPAAEYAVLLIGLIIAVLILCSFNLKKGLLIIGAGIVLFLALSYLLLTKGYIWNYSRFPILTILSPLLAKKIFQTFWRYESIIFAHQNTSLRNLFFKTFACLKYKISTVYSNKEVLELLKNFRPHYIILDPADTETPASNIAEQIKIISPHTHIVIPEQKPDIQQFIFYIILKIKSRQFYSNTPSQKQPPVVQNIVPSIIKTSHKKHPSSTLKNLLIIDDERDCADLIKYYFSRKGYNVEAASSGEEALDKINEHRPDIVILDIRMQGMDGLVILESIKKKDPSILVIMATAAKEKATVKEAFKLGANHYLIKPFSLSKLEQIIKKC